MPDVPLAKHPFTSDSLAYQNIATSFYGDINFECVKVTKISAELQK